MLVMRATEDSANPLGELVSAEQAVGLDHFALAVNPLGLYGVQPRALLWQQAARDPDTFATLFHLSVMLPEPAPDLSGDVPAGVVPDEEQNLLAKSFEPLGAPSEKLRRYGAHGPPVHESQPRLIQFGQIESVAGYGLRLRIVLGERLLNEAHRLALFGPTAQSWQSKPAPPTFVLKAHYPFGIGPGYLHQPIAASFSLVEEIGRGEPPLSPHPSHP